jgi:hypothetical protein
MNFLSYIFLYIIFYQVFNFVFLLISCLGCIIISFNVTPKHYSYIYRLSSKAYGAMKKHNSKCKTINNNRAFFSHCFSNALKLSPMIYFYDQDNPQNQPREKKLSFVFRSISIMPYIYREAPRSITHILKTTMQQ